MCHRREGRDYSHCEKLKKYVDYPYFSKLSLSLMDTVRSNKSLEAIGGKMKTTGNDDVMSDVKVEEYENKDEDNGKDDSLHY
jgi:hypothetical protein